MQYYRKFRQREDADAACCNAFRCLGLPQCHIPVVVSSPAFKSFVSTQGRVLNFLIPPLDREWNAAVYLCG